MKKILIVGHSHIGALKNSNQGDDFEFCSLVGPSGVSDFKKKPISPSDYDALVFSIHGSHYNIFGLVRHLQPFDFYLAEESELPIDDQAELLPMGIVESVFKRHLAGALGSVYSILDYAVKGSTFKAYFLESPPPISSEEHIRKHPSSFRAAINNNGVSSAAFRYKLWRLQAKFVQEHCAALNVKYIPAPRESQDAQGFLREEYWNIDPTHANDAYGALVLNQIRSLHYPSNNSAENYEKHTL